MADEKPVPVNFIDNPHAPQLFSSSVSGFWVHDGCVHITLEAARIDHKSSPGPVNRVVVARLTMPIPATQGLLLGLQDFMQKQGILPDAGAAPTTPAETSYKH